MAYSGTLLKIGSTNINKILKSEYDVGYHKLWSSDSGRGMDGRNSGTLIGIFTKLTITVGEMKQSEAQSLLNAINVSNKNVTYFDPQKNTTHTESFYFGDVNIKLKKQSNGRYEPVQFTIIANNPR